MTDKTTDAEKIAWLTEKTTPKTIYPPDWDGGSYTTEPNEMLVAIRDRLASLSNSTVSRTLAADTSDANRTENSTLRAAEVTPQVDNENPVTITALACTIIEEIGQGLGNGWWFMAQPRVERLLEKYGHRLEKKP